MKSSGSRTTWVDPSRNGEIGAKSPDAEVDNREHPIKGPDTFSDGNLSKLKYVSEAGNGQYSVFSPGFN
jgi:hypothetical protein